jgi:DIS3-like exonuclease 1
MDAEANVLTTWYGRTVIRSACEMEYEQAQALLDGKDIVPGLDASVCKKLKPSVVLLAQAMRKIRVTIVLVTFVFIALYWLSIDWSTNYGILFFFR